MGTAIWLCLTTYLGYYFGSPDHGEIGSLIGFSIGLIIRFSSGKGGSSFDFGDFGGGDGGGDGGGGGD